MLTDDVVVAIEGQLIIIVPRYHLSPAVTVVSASITTHCDSHCSQCIESIIEDSPGEKQLMRKTTRCIHPVSEICWWTSRGSIQKSWFPNQNSQCTSAPGIFPVGRWVCSTTKRGSFLLLRSVQWFVSDIDPVTTYFISQSAAWKKLEMCLNDQSQIPTVCGGKLPSVFVKAKFNWVFKFILFSDHQKWLHSNVWILIILQSRVWHHFPSLICLICAHFKTVGPFYFSNMQISTFSLSKTFSAWRNKICAS